MKISVVTVVYNGASTLQGCIDSVASQSHDDVEYIVVDGGSTDGTIDLIQNNEGSINKWISEPDNGIYDAMNKGLRMATGEVVGLLNADDMYEHTDVLKEVAGEFVSSKADCVYGDLVYVRASDPTKVIRTWRSGAANRGYFERGLVPAHPSFFIRTSALNEVGEYRTDMRIAADYEFMFRALHVQQLSFSYMRKTLVRMRTGGESNNSLRNIKQGNQEIYRAWKIHNQRVPLLLPLYRLYRKLRQFL